MNIDLRNNRIEAVVSVVIAFNKNKFTVQPIFELAVFLNTAFPAALEYKISEKEDSIFRLNPLIMFADDRFIHFLNRFKRPVTISDDISVRKVII